MMGRQSGQISMLILDIEELIPENHLLRKINQMISFDFIYDLVASYYPTNGRPSVDPVFGSGETNLQVSGVRSHT